MNTSSHLCQYGDEVAVKVHGLVERQQDRLISPGEGREISGAQNDAFKVDRGGARAPQLSTALTVQRVSRRRLL